MLGEGEEGKQPFSPSVPCFLFFPSFFSRKSKQFVVFIIGPHWGGSQVRRKILKTSTALSVCSVCVSQTHMA